MKRNIEIKKKLEFPSMIGEIIAISLENHLRFIDDENIEGYLTILGKYKKTIASQLEEDFKYDIPVEISLTEKIDSQEGKIDINNFYYDVLENNTLLCNIEITIEGLEIIENERECDGDPIDSKEIEIPHLEEIPIKEEKREIKEEVENNNDFVFNIDESKESYGSFVVYIVRENETINTIIEKYNSTIEEIEKYNDIKKIDIGSKIIIPIINEENK